MFPLPHTALLIIKVVSLGGKLRKEGANQRGMTTDWYPEFGTTFGRVLIV